MNFLTELPSFSIRPILEGKKTTRYRNNIIFTIGYDSFSELQIGPLQVDKTVKSVESNLLCSNLAVEICNIFQRYLVEMTDIPVFQPDRYHGFWRHIQIRENTKGEYLINLRVHNLDSYQEVFHQEREKLVNYLKHNSQYQLLQINYQEIVGRKEPTPQDPIHTYYHTRHLFQQMLDKNFIIHLILS